jgi:methyl-accepting chemotaxis protein
MVYVTSRSIESFSITDSAEMILEGQRERIKLGADTMALSLGKALVGVSDEREEHDIIKSYIQDYRYEEDNSGYYFVYRGTTCFVHPITPAQEGQDLGQNRDANGVVYVRDMSEATRKGGGFVYFLFDKPHNDGTHADAPKMAYAEMIPGTDLWVGTGVYIDIIDAHKAAMEQRMSDEVSSRMVVIVISIVVMVGAVLIPLCLSILRSITRPLKSAIRVAEAVAKRDFTIDINVTNTDEIGKLQRSMANIRDNLKLAIENLNKHLLKMVDSTKNLNATINHSSDALASINNNMNTIQTETDSQMQSVEQTSDSVTGIIEQIDTLKNAVETQAANINESSAAIEEMVANIASIRSTVNETSGITRNLSVSSEGGRKTLVKLVEELKALQERAAVLQNANATIANIAAQTNILAMNAAVEAAHAGEAGRGFAVVAGEIRKLAELSAKESESIAVEIKNMGSVIIGITKVSDETMGTMDTIFSGINDMDTSFTIVNNAVEEQASGGNQILIALQTMQETTAQVQEGTSAIYAGSGLIHKEIEKLRKISRDVTDRVQEVRVASTDIAESLKNAKSIAGADPEIIEV